MKIATLIVSRNRPDLVTELVEKIPGQTSHDNDIYVIEMGTDSDKLTEHTSLWYRDDDFKGKCYGHNIALDLAQKCGQYDYYLVTMNDVFMEGDDRTIDRLIEVMEENPRMAILSPANMEGAYPSSQKIDNSQWHAVTTCDYLCFIMRGSALEEVDFLNPTFKYSWGAIHELSYKLYLQNWFIAYSDEISYKHLGGTTYGAKNTQTISREEYQIRAKQFAYNYFVDNYGDDWDTQFWLMTKNHDIQHNTFTIHRNLWASGFEQPPKRIGSVPDDIESLITIGKVAPDDEIWINIGCGKDYREGWLNIDSNPEVQPDVICSALDIWKLDEASATLIEADHSFEHFIYKDAVTFVQQCHRVLTTGGRLFLELPNLDFSITLLNRHFNEKGYDLAMGGLYGYIPEIEREGVSQVHKWGWTCAALKSEMKAAGFSHVYYIPPAQNYRAATALGRDMRVIAIK